MDRSGRAESSAEHERRLQALSETFTEAWKKATSVNIQNYLPPTGDPLRHKALCKLVKAELPIRWQRQQRVLLEAYLQRYPELGSPAALPVELIYEELRVRQLHGDRVPLEDYRRRFPAQYAALEGMLHDSGTVVGSVKFGSGPPSAAGSDQPPAAVKSNPPSASGAKPPVMRLDPPSATASGSVPPPGFSAPIATVGMSAINAAASLTINGYKLTKRLGSGSFAEVWEGEAPGGFPVAVKRVMKPMDDDAAQRELASLESIKTLRHPFLLQTQTSFFHENHLYIVMELADGTLRDRAKQCQKDGLPGIPLPELLLYFREAAEALDYMHSKHLIHRDVKPQNILLSNGHTKVADFGLAAALEVDRMLMSASGSGTPAYMAPEVWQRKVSARSDQYSLAFAYAEQRLGRWVFTGRDLPSLMIAHLQSDPELDPLPAPEQTVLRKALAKDPANRYASCQAFVEALEESLANELHRQFPTQSRRNSLSSAIARQSRMGGTTHADDGTGEMSNPTATVPMAPTVAAPPPAPRRSLLVAFLVGLLVMGLGGGAFWFFGMEHSKASGFALLVPGARTLHAGEAGTILVQVRRDSYAGPVAISLQNLPPHCEAANVTIPEGANESQVVLLAGPDAAPVQNHAIIVRATGGDIQQEGELRLTLEPLNYKLPNDWRPAAGAVLTANRNRAYYDKIDVGPKDLPVRFLLVPREKDNDPATFYIMEDKVWVALFRKFGVPGRSLKNSEWEELFVNRTNAESPVMGVVAADAEQFARWLGGELPTTREWDRAFGRPPRGAPNDGPHKEPFKAGEFGIGINQPLPRGQATRDRSPVGARDMAGNGLEWTSVAFDEVEDLGVRTPDLGKLTSGDLVFLRGARYKERSKPLSYQEIEKRPDAKPPLPGAGGKVDDTVGFRVVLEPDR